jgi:hypothetical protein
LWYRKFGKSKFIRTTHFSNFFPYCPLFLGQGQSKIFKKTLGN